MRDLNFEDYLSNVEYYNKKYKELKKQDKMSEEQDSQPDDLSAKS